MTWLGGKLSDINNVLQDQIAEGIIESGVLANPLVKRWKPRIKTVTAKTQDAKYVMTAELFAPIAGGGRAEAADITTPVKDSYGKPVVSCYEVNSVTGMTQEELDSKSDFQGMVDYATRRLQQAKKGYDALTETLLHGDGTGRLGKTSGISGSGTAGDPYILTLANTVADFGWATTSLIRVGMKIDVGTWAGVAKFTGVTVIAKTSTTITLGDVGTYGGTVNSASGLTDSIVFIAGAVDSASWGSSLASATFRMPYGLLAVIDDGAGTANSTWGSWNSNTFQGLDRTATANSFLKATIAHANDWGSGSEGTPQSYDIDTIIGFVDDLQDNNSECEITALLMNRATARSINRKTRTEIDHVRTVGGDGEIIPGWQTNYVNYDGKKLPIFVIPKYPDGIIDFVDENQLGILVHRPEYWHEYNGSSPWFQPGERNLTYEAWLRGVWNLMVKRADCMGRLCDLNTSE